MWSLAMVTKAGVPANKLVVGISSYGRSFRMAEEGCTGPMCTFLGTREDSMAAKGECTDTAGYIADAEIRQLQLQGSGQSTYDADSDSDIFVYHGAEWVGWMDTDTKSRRVDLYQGLNFGGTSDWAIDLQYDHCGSTDQAEDVRCG